jgi:hypothetical protein
METTEGIAASTMPETSVVAATISDDEEVSVLSVSDVSAAVSEGSVCRK